MIAQILDMLSANEWSKSMLHIALAKGKNELPKNFIALFNKLKK